MRAGPGGLVTEHYLRDLLGPLCRVRIYPATMSRGWPSPEAMQTDHTVPWTPDGPPGQSGVGNYGPMTTTHHRIKTHGRWQVRQPFPGLYVWRDQHGATYLVDGTGTRRLDQAA